MIWYLIVFVFGLFFLMPYIRYLLSKAKLKWVLKNISRNENYEVFNDVTLSVEEKKHKADYLILSNKGVFVITTKIFKPNPYWNSYIKGNEEEKEWVLGHSYMPGKNVPHPLASVPGKEDVKINKFINPIIQNQEFLKRFENILISNEVIIDSIPIVILMPRVKGLDVKRKDNSNIKLIFLSSLTRIIYSNKTEVISDKELEKIKDVIKLETQN